MANGNAVRARDLLRDRSGFEGQPTASRVAAAQALAFIAIAEELSRANDFAERSAEREANDARP